MKKLFLFLFLLILTVGCKEKSIDEPVDKSPSIESFSPASGASDSVVTIIGKNFSASTIYNLISVGSYTAVPISATSTQLVFKIPYGVPVGSYSISVKVSGITATASQKFAVTSYESVDSKVENYNYVIGTQSIGPTYKFTSDDKLVETAKAIYDMGSNMIKISLSTGSYGLSGSYADLTSLVRDNSSFRTVLDMPFRNYFFWAAGHANWSDGYSESERYSDSIQIYNLTRYLLTQYNNTGKTFYLGHWEGDWYLLPNYDTSYVPSDIRLQGMIAWYRTRQNAVDKAKSSIAHSNVDVFHYAEVNQVVDAKNKGLKRIVNYVLPYTNVDYVSYSSYDAQQLPQSEYSSVLDYIQSNIPAKAGLTGKRVFIGEMGFSLQKSGGSTTQHELDNRNFLMKPLIWGCPFVLYWEMYNNEIDATSGAQKGFWLIDDKNVKQPLYFTYFNFLKMAKQWVINYKALNGVIPPQNLYLNWASETLKTKPLGVKSSN